MLSQGSLRRALIFLIIPVFLISTVLIARSGGYADLPKLTTFIPSSSAGSEPKESEKPKPLYKPVSSDPPPPPITDNFPLAAKAISPSNIPPIPPWNTPPIPHVNVSTPLFIGFTRNWRLLQQTVVSYLTAGWPSEDIYVIENTGVMHSNRNGQLTLQNPFYIDHNRLTKILQVNVIQTPTLFTFAQLQNFYTYTALENGWEHYFWAHMDTIVLSDEELPVDEARPYESLYTKAVKALQETLDPSWGPLATRWFAYDRLALVRTQGFVDVGGWDTMIPFYMTDCDMHERLWMAGLKIEDAFAGKVWDVASTLDDLAALYRRGAVDDTAKADDKNNTVSGEEGEKERRWQLIKEKTTVIADTASDPTSTSLPTAPADASAESAAVADNTSLPATPLSENTPTSSPVPSSSSPSSPSTPSAPTWHPTQLASPFYTHLLAEFDTLQQQKMDNPSGRNTWQARQRGGQGEPFYRDPDGFEHGVQMWMEFGRSVFDAKWGRGPCDIRDAGLVEGDAWKVVAEWEKPEVRREYAKERERERKEREREEKERGKERERAKEKTGAVV